MNTDTTLDFPCTSEKLLESGYNGNVRELRYMIGTVESGKETFESLDIYIYFDASDTNRMIEYIKAVRRGNGIFGENELNLEDRQWLECCCETFPVKDGYIDFDAGCEKTGVRIYGHTLNR